MSKPPSHVFSGGCCCSGKRAVEPAISNRAGLAGAEAVPVDARSRPRRCCSSAATQEREEHGDAGAQ